MPILDPRIDAYIKKSQPFAQPILLHFRSLVHKACPEVIETVKWGMPFFDYKGLMCHMAAFKAHCAIGFWKAAMMQDNSLQEKAKSEEAMGHFGRISSKADLPSDKYIISLIREAMSLNDAGVKMPPKKAVVPEIPDDLQKALKKNKPAAKRFAALAPTHQKEYVQWILDAKREATRVSRLEKMIEKLEAEYIVPDAKRPAKK